MKNLFLITLLTVAFFNITSCNSDDSKEAEIALTGSAWKLTSLSISLVDQTSTLDECDLMDIYTFTDDGKFTFESHEKESTGGCSTETSTGTWTADNSVAGSRRFDATFDGNTEKLLFIIEGKELREDVVEGPDSQGLTKTFTYRYTKQ